MKDIFHKPAFDRISNERKEKILEVGVDEFSKNGFDGANINVIANKAGISIGLMYKYFSTKEDLFLTCINYGTEILEEVLTDIIESDEKLLKKTERLIRETQLHSRSHENYTRLYCSLTSENNARFISKVSKLETLSASVYIKAIEQAKADGDIRDDCDPKLFAFFLDSILTTLQFSYVCDYYRERFKIFTGIDICDDDDAVAEQLLKFLESAFTFKK